MSHRHLLPAEIDLLADADTGVGAVPLPVHIAECGECRRRVEDARIVVDALDALPHLAPDRRLADRVMAEVPVFVPAHVAVRDSVRRWIPRSRRLRIAAAAVATSVAAALTAALVWLTARADAVAFIGEMLSDRLRGVVMATMRNCAILLVGEPAFAALRAGGVAGASLLLLGMVAAAVGTIAGLRRLATVHARRA